jgi:hypothetical protein
MLRKIIEELQYNLEHYDKFDGLESIFAHVKTNAAAFSFCARSAARTGDKRKDYAQPVNPLPPQGQDIE